MSDTSQGPGWWQASDGKWYPPEQAAGAAPTAPPAGQPPAYGAPAPGYGTPPAYGAPAGGPGGPLATWGQRALGWVIDWAITVAGYIVVWILAMIFGAVSDALGAIVILVGYLGLIAYTFYIAFMAGAVGGTPGMRLTGLKLVKLDTGQLAGGGTGIVRLVVAWAIQFFTCGLGGLLDYLFPLWDDKRQTLHDKAVQTVVLADQPKMDFGPDVFKLS